MKLNPAVTHRLSLNTSGSYSDCQSKELNSRNSGFAGEVFANIQQTSPWELRLSFYGGGSTPYISLQGKGSSFYYYGVNLNRSFLKDKRLNISLFASNIFQKYNSYSNEVWTDTFRSWSKNSYPSRRYGISISWRFGELKTQVKKTQRSITNDDVKSVGDNKSAGSMQ